MVLKTVFEHINEKVLGGWRKFYITGEFIGCVPQEILGGYEVSMLVIVINRLCEMLCSTGILIGVIRGVTQKFPKFFCHSLTAYQNFYSPL